jgi:precorrin-6B methylase 1
MLRTSSIVAMVSSSGIEPGLSSFSAAMAARAKVALLDIEAVFIMGIRPMFRLKIKVELSAFRTASLNLAI